MGTVTPVQSEYPPCFDSEKDYLAWIAAARITTLEQWNDIGTKYCCDCTPEFRREMQIEGRCTCDTIRFVKIGGGIEGRIREWKARRK